MKYIVLEIQTNANGEVANLLTVYNERSAAENKYYTILAAAALSELPVHLAMILTNLGTIVKSETFNRIPETE